MSATKHPTHYVVLLNHIRRTAAASLRDGEPFVYLVIRKASPPTGFQIHLADGRGPIGDIERSTPMQGEQLYKPSGTGPRYWAVSARFRPAAVVLWCQQEAERLA